MVSRQHQPPRSLARTPTGVDHDSFFRPTPQMLQLCPLPWPRARRTNVPPATRIPFVCSTPRCSWVPSSTTTNSTQSSTHHRRAGIGKRRVRKPVRCSKKMPRKPPCSRGASGISNLLTSCRILPRSTASCHARPRFAAGVPPEYRRSTAAIVQCDRLSNAALRSTAVLQSSVSATSLRPLLSPISLIHLAPHHPTISPSPVRSGAAGAASQAMKGAMERTPSRKMQRGTSSKFDDSKWFAPGAKVTTI